ncbi:translation initiation factor IF-2-like [Eptesicus fuscus]|uniref:translation initiation factor IF-2-like n=1 Tax=Eptesicus fuscus TaxID=29078 RepID=UPI002403FD13|nr:translation initiation factor IF-2-like [Eptesicus fuscus]
MAGRPEAPRPEGAAAAAPPPRPGCPLQGGVAVPPLRGAGAERGELVRDGSRSSALPAIADVATAPPPSRGEKQSERFRRRRGAGSEAGAGPPRLPAPLGSPPSARRPPLPTRTSRARSGWDSPAPRPGPRAPRLVTPSSLSAPRSGREGSAGRGGGERGAPGWNGESQAPRRRYLLPRPARGHRDDTDSTPKPLISPQREVTRLCSTSPGAEITSRVLRGRPHTPAPNLGAPLPAEENGPSPRFLGHRS